MKNQGGQRLKLAEYSYKKLSIVKCLMYMIQVFVSSVIQIRKLKVCEPVFGSSHVNVAIFALFAIYATLQDLSVLAGPTIKC